MAPLIIESPTNSIPNPAKMPPIFCALSFFVKARMKAPMPANVARITEEEIVFPPNMPRATSCPVIVVPMFAPKITVAACGRDMIPAFTNPIVITLVALEL